jgi:hypothetical protein
MSKEIFTVLGAYEFMNYKFYYYYVTEQDVCLVCSSWITDVACVPKVVNGLWSGRAHFNHIRRVDFVLVSMIAPWVLPNGLGIKGVPPSTVLIGTLIISL